MSGLTSIYRITGTALNAQSRSLDLIAQNMANAQVVTGSEATAYRAKRPVFAPLLESAMSEDTAGVQITSLAESQAQVERQRQPEHPLADKDGYIYLANVNMVEEMTNMVQATRNYQSNVEVMNTSKDLLMRTLSLGS
ncbi:MAG TPA: flagellar basal body rod protein FlgC [Candidatus Acidoferrum sp.]|nr:flagellar basal body rod protein FlgC [Candidatus Acidoferrum sp.]